MKFKTIITAAVFALAGMAHAQSFNCAKAGNATEKAICSVPILGQLDTAIASNYKAVIANGNGGKPADIQAAQRKWIGQRNKCGADEACIAASITERNDDLCGFGVPTGIHPCGQLPEYETTSTPNSRPVMMGEPNMSPERVTEIATTAGRAYKRGGVVAVMALENECWSVFVEDRTLAVAASCMATAVSGAFADASIARSQRRSGHPEYQGPALRARMIAKTAVLGMNETDAMTMMQDHVLKYQASILNGLLAAGV